MNQVYSGTVVVIQKDTKTVGVEILNHYTHPKYRKTIERRKKIWAHNENLSLRVGEKVVIKTSRPIAKTKKFLVWKKLINDEEQEKKG
jgi:small subunit ribosomal protein S17